MAEILLTGSCGDNATFNLYDDGLLEILGTGKMTTYTDATLVPWDTYRTNITKINIAEGITLIGDYSFKNTQITEIIIPSSVQYIRPYSFHLCRLLTDVKIPDGTTYIGDYAFFYCIALANLTIGNKVAKIAQFAFENCTSLVSVTIPESVTTIERQAFGDCTNLELVTVLGTTPPTLTYNTVFTGTNIARINVPFSALDAYKTADIWKDYADLFHGVESLSELFTRIANSIRGKTGKTDSIVAQNFPEEIEKIIATVITNNYSKIISTGEAVFTEDVPSRAFDTSKITKVTICDGVTTIGANAFSSCTWLTSITIPDSVTFVGGQAFLGCTGLTRVTLGTGVAKINFLCFSKCSSLTNLTITKSDAIVTLTSGALSNTPIATSTDTGFIYVPENLIDQYKADSVWSTFADKFRGIESE